MTSKLSAINLANNVAYLAGVFNWQIEDGKYTNPDGKTVSFHVISNMPVPAAQFVSGAINTFNLISGASKTDPNQGLFNTSLSSTGLRESFSRKYTINRIPFANYDQPVPLGTGSQEMTFNVLFSGTMYLTAMQNLFQCLFNNKEPGLGTLFHPFYQKIKNVLPIRFNTVFEPESMNCVVIELTFVTSDVTHLLPNAVAESKAQKVQKYFIGVQSAISSIQSAIFTARSLARNVRSSL